MRNFARLQLCSILVMFLIIAGAAICDASGQHLTASQRKTLHDIFARIGRIQKAIAQPARAAKAKNRAPAALITGTVTNSSDSQPIGNATIFVFDTVPNMVGSTMTDGSGDYAVDVPAGGPYYVLAVADPFTDEAYDNIACEGGGCDITQATLVAAPSGGISFALDPTGNTGNSITGTVTEDGSGAPIQGTAYLYEINTQISYSADTDGNGFYSIQGFADGSYVLAVFSEPEFVPEVYDNIPCPGGMCDLTGATIFDFTGNSQYSNIDFGLSHYAAIEGDITVSGGTAPTTDLTAFDTVSGNQYYGQSDANGHYRIAGTAVGDYNVVAVPTGNYIGELYNNVRCPNGICDFSAGTLVPVTDGQTTFNINFALDTGGRIEGFVTSNSGPVESEVMYIPGLDSSALSEIDGHYQLEGLPSGNYHLLAFGNQMLVDELYDNIPCPEGYCDFTSGNLISVSEGATTTINIALSDGGRIQGDVFVGGAPPAFGEFRIFFYNSSGALVASATAMGDSYFQSPALPPGNYFARTDDAFDVASELYDDILCPAGLCNILSGTPITVNANQVTSGITMDLDNCTGGLSMNTATLPDGFTGTSYSTAFSVNGTAPFTFGISQGSLPPGISLSSDGTLSGVPTAAGDYTFTVAVSTAGHCGQWYEFTIHVSLPLCLFCDEFEDGTLSSDWTFNKGTWNEDGHHLVGTFTGKAQALAIPGFTGCVTCTLQATVQTSGGSISVLGWYKDKKNLLELLMKQPSNKWILKFKQNGTMVAKTKFTQTLSANVDYQVEISYASGSFVVKVDGTTIMTVPVPSDPFSGSAGLQVKKATGTFDRISIN